MAKMWTSKSSVNSKTTANVTLNVTFRIAFEIDHGRRLFFYKGILYKLHTGYIVGRTASKNGSYQFVETNTNNKENYEHITGTRHAPPGRA